MSEKQHEGPSELGRAGGAPEVSDDAGDESERSSARRSFFAQTAAVAAAALVCTSPSEAQAQAWKGGKVNSTKDWMLFTDKSRTAGVLVTGEAAIAVTSAFVQGFEATYFNKDWKTAPTTSDLRSKATGLEGGGSANGDRLDQAVGELATATGVFSLGTTGQTFKDLSVKTERTPVQLTLNSKKVWRPGGEIRTRIAGSATTTFIIGPQDLRGRLTPSSRLGAVGLISGRPAITASSDGCGACGTCGACAICALCGEVNAGSVAVAAIEVINVSSLSAVAFTPATLDPITDRFPTGVLDLQQASLDLRNSIARLNTAATKVRAT
jgi:hypothetical protein